MSIAPSPAGAPHIGRRAAPGRATLNRARRPARLCYCAPMSSTPLQSVIPVVSMADLSSYKRASRARAAEAIREAFGHFGLVYIADHDLDPEVTDAFYRGYEALCAEPLDFKQRLSRPELWFQRGWTPPNTEKAVVAGGQPDFKECFFAAPEPMDPVAVSQYPEVYARNVWPDGHDGLAEAYTALGHALHDIGRRLLRGAAQALGLAPFAFEAAIHGGPHLTRALRYLPLTQEQIDAHVLWGEEHTDFNLLTLLPGGRFLTPAGDRAARPDHTGGLYLRTRATAEHPEGQLVSGRPPEGCVIAQVGQQLEILTGGTFLATPHIVRPPRVPGWSRESAAHFIHMHAHQTVYPLEPFRTAEAVAAYSPPVLAGTYGLKTLVDIALAPPEALEQLGYRHYDRLAATRGG